MAKKINYFARNFADTRQELINFVKQYYPDVFNDFNFWIASADVLLTGSSIAIIPANLPSIET